MTLLESTVVLRDSTATQAGNATNSFVDWLANVDPFYLSIFTKGAKIVAIVVVAWFAFKFLKVLTGRIQNSFDDDDPSTVTELEQRAKTLMQLLNSIGAVAIGVAATLTIMNLFVPIAPLLAGVGVLGLAISFGAQSLVKDVLSGFFILLENQFVVGDVVEINGKSGLVERLSLRVVTLRDVEGVQHIIPNGSIAMVSNKTRVWARAVLDIGVAYKENVDNVIRVVGEVGTSLWNDSEWQPKLTKEPTVWGVQELGESSVNIRLAVETRPGKQWEVKRELWRRVKNRFDTEGIEIPFPQRTLHLGSTESELRILLQGRSDASGHSADEITPKE